MSHDFEPTDAEKEMLSYMKDIEVNQKQTELGEIIAGAILDGQNQIHDLYKEKATAQQIEYRMRRAYIYWMDRLNKANDQQLQKARQDWLREEIVKLENEKVSVRDCERCNNCETATSTCERIIWGNTINEVLQTIIDRYHSELDQDPVHDFFTAPEEVKRPVYERALAKTQEEQEKKLDQPTLEDKE